MARPFVVTSGRVHIVFIRSTPCGKVLALGSGEMLDGERRLLTDLEALQAELVLAGTRSEQGGVHEAHRASSVNMAHFLALRGRDRRELQECLSRRGLSSLGRCEPHVLATVNAVVDALRALEGRHDEADPETVGALSFEDGDARLAANAARLVGTPHGGRSTCIMVTLPSEAASDTALVDALVASGMEIARINCAHDDAVAWRAMAGNVRRSGAAHRRGVRVLMDLAGPKLRTGPVVATAGVLRLHPRRDEKGLVIEAARAQLIGAGSAVPSGGLPIMPVSAKLLRRLSAGDRLHLVDARGARRRLRVVGFSEWGPIVQTKRTTYVIEGLEVRVGGSVGRVGPLPPRAGALLLHVGDELDLTADLTPATPAGEGERNRIGCTLPAALLAMRPGQRVLLDDGKIAGVVTAADSDSVRLRVTETAAGGTKLRAEKGINVPDTVVPVPALSEKDQADLITLVEVADIVGLSFVREPRDVEALVAILNELGGTEVGIILKIETTLGFKNLPALLLASMAHRDIGVMIARGDLAVEAGYERMAELQEEVLWLCEAAHVPVVWATEVLDHLAKTGRPSRAEITDAAMSERAECVMLNKGPFIVHAVQVLDDILKRMASLQSKKSPLLRQLTSWTETRPEGA